MNRSFKPTALLIILLMSTIARAQVRLAFNYQEGKTYTQKIDFDIEQEMDGRSTKMKISGTYSMTVSSRNDSITTLRTTYDRMSMWMDMGTMEISADSDKPDTSMASNPGGAIMGRMFAAMIGKYIYLDVDRDGKVRDVRGLAKMGDDMLASVTVSDEGREAMKQAFQQQFNEASMKQTFAPIFNFLPNRIVKVNDSWKRSFKGEGPIASENTYTVTAIKGKLVTIDAKSDLSVTTTMGQTMKGTQTNLMQVDATSGMIVHSEMHQEFSGDMKMSTKGVFVGSVR